MRGFILDLGLADRVFGSLATRYTLMAFSYWTCRTCLLGAVHGLPFGPSDLIGPTTGKLVSCTDLNLHRHPTDSAQDIIEGVNLDVDNHMTLHSSQGCTIAGSGMTGHLDRNDCAFYPPNYNPGCGISAPVNSNSYGSPFNLNGGGKNSSATLRSYFDEL